MKKSEKKKQRRLERGRLELAHRKKKARTMMIASTVLIGVICLAVYFSVSLGEDDENIQNKKQMTLGFGSRPVWACHFP